ncbi:sorbosone dehydrogenase family protein [Halobacillus sp. BBL2006]|uniref:PQQ-dependent sugar dehydrogenase n=1 Tax=Halobacillus sp. BBL2006 TaxID=1543706 RepID=UPI000543CBAB|nr:PQQ-dependent sugar dehydrogenase [Halobacillus sp. BBL2006]KHE68799.1 quinoprotein glucose dehydrogenase [Halobacillus sp. BBL2006]
MKNKIVFLTLIMSLLLLVACSNERETEKKEPVTDQKGKFEIVIGNLNSPWDIEAHQGTFFISEREGNIASWTQGGGLKRFPVQTEKEIKQIGEGGLLGFKLTPEFEENQQAYAYHTYEEEQEVYNRVVLLKKEVDKWVEVKPLLEKIPGAQFHNGGRLEIAPDGSLFVTTGDALNKSLPQKKNSLAGKILRLNPDGSVPEDNPYQDSYVFSYGHRNPQGLTWNENGDLFASEHGPDNRDEVNLIEAGQNYGWPLIVGDEEEEGLITPLYQTGDRTWAPSGIVAYDEKLFIASLRGTAVRTLSFQGDEPAILTDEFGRIRDVEVVNDSLYFITNNTDGRGSPSNKDDRLLQYYP